MGLQNGQGEHMKFCTYKKGGGVTKCFEVVLSQELKVFSKY